jgi:hypothetical protein
MATGSQGTSLDRREPVSLIGLDFLKGTLVYRSNGDLVGRMDQVILDKFKGKCAYAVIFFIPKNADENSTASWLRNFACTFFRAWRGTLEYYPLPWSLLTYNPALEGYEVDVSEQQLAGAPKFAKRQGWDWSNLARCRQVCTYYGVAPSWAP